MRDAQFAAQASRMLVALVNMMIVWLGGVIVVATFDDNVRDLKIGERFALILLIVAAGVTYPIAVLLR